MSETTKRFDLSRLELAHFRVVSEGSARLRGLAAKHRAQAAAFEEQAKADEDAAGRLIAEQAVARAGLPAELVERATWDGYDENKLPTILVVPVAAPTPATPATETPAAPAEPAK